jgi:hypothetical protein
MRLQVVGKVYSLAGIIPDLPIFTFVSPFFTDTCSKLAAVILGVFSGNFNQGLKLCTLVNFGR